MTSHPVEKDETEKRLKCISEVRGINGWAGKLLEEMLSVLNVFFIYIKTK